MQQIKKAYLSTSLSGKILVWVVLLLVVMYISKLIWGESSSKEGFGFDQNQDFQLLTGGEEVYDDFYAKIYDELVYNEPKNDYEIAFIDNETNIIKKNKLPNNNVLDIGCGTGHHVHSLTQAGVKTVGLDKSKGMIQMAKQNYPTCNFLEGDALDSSKFAPSSFTHIVCLYFTIYYIQDKTLFFHNCLQWLKPNGYLVIHLVNRNQFDPILPRGTPLVRPNKRTTTTKVNFDNFSYQADFQLVKETNKATFTEKFKTQDKIPKTRKNEHILYMESQQDILNMAQEAGFLLDGQVDLVHVQYNYQYLYVLRKPS